MSVCIYIYMAANNLRHASCGGMPHVGAGDLDL